MFNIHIEFRRCAQITCIFPLRIFTTTIKTNRHWIHKSFFLSEKSIRNNTENGTCYLRFKTKYLGKSQARRCLYVNGQQELRAPLLITIAFLCKSNVIFYSKYFLRSMWFHVRPYTMYFVTKTVLSLFLILNRKWLLWENTTRCFDRLSAIILWFNTRIQIDQRFYHHVRLSLINTLDCFLVSYLKPWNVF